MKVVRRPLLTFVVKSQRNNLKKFNSRKTCKHAGQNSRLLTLSTCQWLQSRPKRVCIWTPVFHGIQQGRFHIHIVPVNAPAVAELERSRAYVLPVSVVTSLQNIVHLSSALMLFKVLMAMAARDRPSAAESDFLCRHTHSSGQYTGVDCDPTPSQILTRITP